MSHMHIFALRIWLKKIGLARASAARASRVALASSERSTSSRAMPPPTEARVQRGLLCL